MHGTKQTREFHIKVLGRTLEHLGSQMYKRRDAAIAELVANAWDAGADNVWIDIPEPSNYSQTSPICILDDGQGMTPEQIQANYLVVGRNRRHDSNNEFPGRPPMGRKGIGKLAGFGIASRMTVVSWREGSATSITLAMSELKQDDAQAADIPLVGKIGDVPDFARSEHGSCIRLENLKHKTPVDLEKLKEALGRRYSRAIRGHMNIYINDELVQEPNIDFEVRFPEAGERSEILADGSLVKYSYGFARNVISSAELRGFTIRVRGKTAQAPPFYFHVEGTASGQHATKYLSGEIEADFLDEGNDDATDLVSTDRQEIDWETEQAQGLLAWGAALTRKALRDWSSRKGERMESWIFQDAELSSRIEVLETTSRSQIQKFLRVLGEAETDETRSRELADALIKAYEYRHFHDVVAEIEKSGDDPEGLLRLLSHLSEWKVLESRSILEIIKGRIDIIDKFHSMIVNNSPETASVKSKDNMHDLLAGYPWLLNPDWQPFVEERTVTKQLREWGAKDIPEDERERFDFLALDCNGKLVVIEIKRAGYPVELDELQRLERYRDKLSKGRGQPIAMLLIYGGVLNVSDETKANWDRRPDGQLKTWSSIHEQTKVYYEHYRAVLENEVKHPDFRKHELEVAQTRKVIESGSVHRDQSARSKGLGPQDVNYALPEAALPKDDSLN